jgi:trimeric autotransporter adhesin
MNNPIQLIDTIPLLKTSLSRPPLRRDFLLIAFAITCFALLSTARAVTPAPDGGYPNGNTAEGEDALFSLTSGGSNTALGFHALFSNTTGGSNTAVGFSALQNNTTGSSNTALGIDALLNNTTGTSNTATGLGALQKNTTGRNNAANGAGALVNNTTGDLNTATGSQALLSNTTGSQNAANGNLALYSNKTGNQNTANGAQALESNITGNQNTANGFQALENNTAGANNTANGAVALQSNTTGNNNTANGQRALSSNTTGGANTANGNFALFSNTAGSSNTAEGFDALFNNTTGSNNIALGPGAGGSLTTGNNNIDIGNKGVAGESAKIRIGTKGTQTDTFIAGISGVTVARGVGVIIDSDGHLGTVTSSARFKDEIKPMDKASEAILALQPVTFRYKNELDPEGITQFGLVAEQVEKVNRDLVARDDQGKVYTVRYEAVNAMLLNEFLKEHRKIEEQDCRLQTQEATIAQQQRDFQSTIAQQQKEINTLTTILREQASQIRKVSEQLEVSKFGPRVVANDR